MKRTIVKFGAAALLMGMFVALPSCKEKPADTATETTVPDSTLSSGTDSMSMPAAAAEEDTGKGVKQPG